MRCPNCRADNPEGRRFCEECGERLTAAEHRREQAKDRAQRHAARARRAAEDMSPAEQRRQALRARTGRRQPPRYLVFLLLLLIIAGAVTAFVLLRSPGAGAEERTVRSLMQALEERDVLGFLKYSDPVVYELLRQEPQQEPDDFFSYDFYRFTDIRVEVGAVTADGTSCEVKLVGGTLEAGWEGLSSETVDFGRYPRVLDLVKQGDTWYVSNAAQLQLPYDVPLVTEQSEEELEEGL
ncbi:MAG: zinc ribbon domain-containing protein [Candidatus Geothermincolia bacterium]